MGKAENTEMKEEMSKKTKETNLNLKGECL